MSVIAAALAPILVLILLGLALKRARFMPDEAWVGIERLTYYVLFPALLVRSLGRQSLLGVPWPEILGVVVGVLAIVAGGLIVAHRLRPTGDGPAFTSIFQGGVRFNTYIALALAQSFYGGEGLALAAVAAGFMIVLINLLCIVAFTVWGSRADLSRRRILRDILGNPLILACTVGWLLSLSGIGLPGVSADILEIIGRAALPLGLLAVGAALRPQALHGHLVPIAVASVAQFIAKPLLATGLATAVGLQGAAAGVLVIAFMTPTASSAYILARQLGGDTAAMASIITFQTLLAFAAMPMWALLLLR